MTVNSSSKSFRRAGSAESRTGAGSGIFRSFQNRLRTFPRNSSNIAVVRERGESRPFYGWVVVTAAAVGLFLGVFPVFVASFTVFFPAFITEFHAGRGAISLAFTICNIVTACVAPVVGRLCDRIGARPVILASLFLLAVGLIAAQTIGSRLWELYAFSLILGIAAPGTNSVAYGLVVSRWFNRHRGLALGLMMIGLGAGAIVAPPLARSLIARYGWRVAYARFGWASLLLAVPVVAIFLKERPDESSLQLPANEKEGWSWSKIRISRDYWQMIVVFILVSASVQACFIHMAQIVADHGATLDVAATAASACGAAILVGRVATGYFLDRCSGPGVAPVVFAIAAVGITLVSLPATGPTFVGAFLIGFGLGAEGDIIAYLLGRYFGLRSFGSAFGLAFGLFVLAGGIGPLLMGVAFDHFGSYRFPLAAFCLFTALAAVLVARLGPYRFGVKGEH